MTEGPHVIGVSGFMRTGKDSVASLLQEFGYRRVSFADPLRKMARDIDPYISLEGVPAHIVQDITGLSYTACARYSVILDTVGYETAKEIPDFRRFLQRLGTEGVRNNFGDDAWVDLAVRTITDELNPRLGGPRFVIPDVRFPNEAAAIRKLGGVIWRTERPGFEGGAHPSEAMVLEITPDEILRADTLEELGLKVLSLIGVEDDGSILSLWSEKVLANA